MQMREFYDNHIHLSCEHPADKKAFYDEARKAGCIGGNILSLPPKSFSKEAGPYRDRIDHVVGFCDGLAGFAPFFWIDPTEEDAAEQVEYAVRQGIRGFKVLCSKYAPCDGIQTYREIAKHRLPTLFHSGVLWDGQVSSAFNRPMAFEGLMVVDDFRFALAHVSWPWCDECIALYGKIRSARSGGDNHSECSSQMFIDTTPGTPYCYRKQVLENAYLIDYDLKNRLVFGSDCFIGAGHAYDGEWANRWLDWDYKIMCQIRETADDAIPVPHDLPSADEMFRLETQANYLKFLTGKES